jgi:hypothetical protein
VSIANRSISSTCGSINTFEQFLPRIRIPMLVMQGADDERDRRMSLRAIRPTSTRHPPYIDAPSALHRRAIRPTSTRHPPYIDAPSALHSCFKRIKIDFGAVRQKERMI